jgi:multiple sugar transport system permease protein
LLTTADRSASAVAGEGADVARERARRRRPGSRAHRLAPYGFVGPFYLLFLTFTVAPIVYDFYLSFFKTTIVGGTHFGGFSNYVQVFQYGAFWQAVLRVIEYGVGVTAVILICATTFALLLDFEYVRFVRTFRIVLFLPYAIPGAISVLIWGFLYEPQLGTLTRITSAVGIGSVEFLDVHLVIFSIGNIAVWAYTGFNMLIIYTALQGVPLENVESAIVDGASTWRIAVSIKLPQIRGVIAGIGLLGVLGALQLFTEPSVLAPLTDSIPSQYTAVMSIDNVVTIQNNYNFAAALAFVLAVVSLVFAGTLLAIGIRRRGGFDFSEN